MANRESTTQLDRLTEFLVEDILNASDEEILAEVGGSAELSRLEQEVIEKLRALDFYVYGPGPVTS